MPEERKKPLIGKEMRGFLLKLGLGFAAIGGAAWAISEWLKQPWKSWEEGYKAVLETKVQLFDKWINEGEGSLTDEQREMLHNLMDQEDYYQKNPPPGADIAEVLDKAVNLAIIIFGGIFGYKIASILEPWIRKKINQGEIKTDYALTYAILSGVSYKNYLEGKETIATNSHLWLQNFFENYDVPHMQTIISTMQAQLPSLTGWKLAYWSSLIPAYQYELTYTVPTILQAPLWTILPPP